MDASRWPPFPRPPGRTSAHPVKILPTRTRTRRRPESPREHAAQRAGHRACRRAQAALKRRTPAEDLHCWWRGGEIDTRLPAGQRYAFTADHPNALAHSGRLAGQELQPVHRRCNASKGDSVAVDIWPAS